MDLKKQQMEFMYTMCQTELNILQKNLQTFLQESKHSQHILNEVLLGNGILGLFSFDRYMSQVVGVLNMARKFNIQLQINGLGQDSTNQARILNFIEMNNAVFKNGSINCSCMTTPTGKLEKKERTHEVKTENRDSCDENYNEGMSITLSNALVNYEELEPKSAKENNTEKLLNTLLPTMKLDHIKINCELEAYIVNVSEYKNLEFFICQIEDFKTLFDISRYDNFNQIPHSALPSDDIFGILEKKDDVKDYIWRAVKVPCKEGANKHKESVYLIDFGENIELTEKCIAYYAPQHFKQIPPLAIKCKLEGIENTFLKSIENSRSNCEQFIQKNEFEKVTIRVLQKEANILHVLLLDYSKNYLNTVATQIDYPKNPFLNDELSKEEQLALPLSAVSRTSTHLPLNNNPNVGDTIQIMVTHIISPISFYAIIQSDLTNSSSVISCHEHHICLSQRIIHPPKVNDIVLSHYHKDHYYYRAKVINSDQELDRYKVFYVDFGNTEVVSLCDLAKCAKEQLEEPLRAVLFRLHNLSLIKYDETQALQISYMNIRLKNALENVVVMILDQILNVKVMEKHNDELCIALLDEQYDSIPNMLINMGVVNTL